MQRTDVSKPAGVAPSPAHVGMSFREFVCLIAAIMALVALAIDSMLPALPEIGQALHVSDVNHRQLVVTCFLVGFGLGQPVYGTLADRYGRRPVLWGCLVAYALFALTCALSGSFVLLLVARTLSGAAAAGTRVVAQTVVRDCYHGRTMARVMSLAFIVFMAVPILAPSIGQIILAFASWRWLFALLGGLAAIVFIWSALRLPETLRPERRMPIDADSVIRAWRHVLTNRMSIGYAAALMLLSGGLYGFVGSAQQIFVERFHTGNRFGLCFAAVAGAMGAAGYVNSRIVERVGMRRVSHSAVIAFVAIAVLHLIAALAGIETLPVFLVLQMALMAAYGLTTSNFGAIAMEPMAAIAGTASSVQGAISAVGGGLIGAVIGQAYNGTTVPYALGLTICGALSLAVVAVTERGRLFHGYHQPPVTG
jgi:DHA1 family bicyclomycin/chloramphenicol resistance-like MFS transporter